MHRYACLIGCFLALNSSSCAKASPVPDALRRELGGLARDISKIVDKNGGGAVAIGEFHGSADLSGHAGPRVQRTLLEELETAGLIISNKKFRFEITGRYQHFHDTRANRAKISGANPDEASNLHTVKLVALVIDRDTGEPLAQRPTGRLIFGPETVPGMLGLSLSNPPLKDPKEISDRIGVAQDHPESQYRIDGARVTGRTGLYGLEMLVMKHGSYSAEKVSIADGELYVPLRASDIYAVRLINNSDYEAAVSLSIDGVNCFEFSESKSRFWIVPPHRHFDVKGWHRTNQVTTKFKVVAGFPATAAEELRLKPSAKVGLVNASFCACWAKESGRPSDEPEVRGRGTGFGDDITIDTKQLHRTIGQVRDNLVIRYER